jgi:hypothetical protein
MNNSNESFEISDLNRNTKAKLRSDLDEIFEFNLVNDEIEYKTKTIKQFEQHIIEHLFNLFLAIFLIAVLFYRTNILADVSNSAEINIVLKSHLLKKFHPFIIETKRFDSKLSKFEIIMHFTRLNSNLKFKKFDLKSTIDHGNKQAYVEQIGESLFRFGLYSGVNNLTMNETCAFYSEKNRKKDENLILNSFFQPDCIENLYNFEIDCKSYQIMSHNSSFSKDCVENLIQNNLRELRYIKYESNLYSLALKNLININFYLLFPETSGNRIDLSISVINLEKSLLIVPDLDLSKIACLVVFLIIFLVNFFSILKFFWTKSIFDLGFLNTVEVLNFYFISRYLYAELRVFFEVNLYLKNDILELKTGKMINLDYLKFYFESSEYLIGYTYTIGCIITITKLSLLNKLTKNIIITFKHCFKDLIGFLFVLVSLMYGYALLFYFSYGDRFEEFSSLSRSIAGLFKLIWGEIIFDNLIEYDWKAFYYLISYLIIIVIIMLNIMLAIILGKYDLVQKDPVFKRDSSNFKLNDYLYLLSEKLLKNSIENKNKFILFVFKKFLFKLRMKNRLFCVQDIQNKFIEHGFELQRVEELFKVFKLKSNDQIDKYKVEILIKNMFELEYRSKDRLRINDRNLIDDYVTNAEWQIILKRFSNLESFCALFEKKLNLIDNNRKRDDSSKKNNN